MFPRLARRHCHRRPSLAAPHPNAVFPLLAAAPKLGSIIICQCLQRRLTQAAPRPYMRRELALANTPTNARSGVQQASPALPSWIAQSQLASSSFTKFFAGSGQKRLAVRTTGSPPRFGQNFDAREASLGTTSSIGGQTGDDRLDARRVRAVRRTNRRCSCIGPASHPGVHSALTIGNITAVRPALPRILTQHRPLHGVFTDPTTTYYVSGSDLLDIVIQSGSGLDEQEAKSLTRDICVAMAYLHEHAIAHRGFKPENALITSDVPLNAAHLVPEVELGLGTCPGYTAAIGRWNVNMIVVCLLTTSIPFGEENDKEDTASTGL